MSKKGTSQIITTERVRMMIENEEYSFERMNSFNYLGATIMDKHEMEVEIKVIIAKGNKKIGKCYIYDSDKQTNIKKS